MMKKTQGKPPQKTSTAVKRRAAQPQQILIDSTKQNFLLVNVCKGATKAQLIEAIEEALKTTDVPLFQERKAQLPGRAAKEVTGEETSADTQPVDALLMLVREEGW